MPLERAASDPHAFVSVRANDDPSVHFRPRPKIEPFPTSQETYKLSSSLQLRSPQQLLLEWTDDLPAINKLLIRVVDMSSLPLEKAKVCFSLQYARSSNIGLILYLTSCRSQRIFFSSKMKFHRPPPLPKRLLLQTKNWTLLPMPAIRRNFSPKPFARVKPLKSQ